MTANGLYVQYGCGLCSPDGWVNFDCSLTLRAQRIPGLSMISHRMGPRFPRSARLGDIISGLPIEVGSCHAMYCSHVLEHLTLNEVPIALRNTFRYLEPGGIFRFVLPDLEQLCRIYLADERSDRAQRFMSAAHLGQRLRPKGITGRLRQFLGHSEHLSMWDEESIAALLAEAGFVNIRRAQYGDHLDPMFNRVEDEGRWTGNLGIECSKP